MSKRILLIDSDESFAQGLSNAIASRGFVADVATNSEQGIALAKSENPDLIVVCVEAQPTNGYMLCTRLKKDEQLKGIPVILTSANATPDSFEKHKKLKTRAEEYLIKPFAPSIMLEKAAELMGVALPDGDSEAEEIVETVEDEPLGLGDLVEGEDEPISLSEQDAQAAHSADEAVVVEEVEEVVSIDESSGGDDDLDMFDQAFDNLGGASGAKKPAPAAEKSFGNLRLATEAEVEEEASEPTELSAPDDDAVLDGLISEEETVEADGAGDARVAELEQQLAAKTKELEQAKKAGGSSAELVKLRKELAKANEQLAAKDGELETARADTAKEKKRAETMAAAAKKYERELNAAKEELKNGGADKDALEAAQAEAARLNEELTALTGEKELLSEERDQLKAQVDELQAASQQNEERAVQAYQQLKEGEKLREKAKQALLIALRLLDENATADDVDRALDKAG